MGAACCKRLDTGSPTASPHLPFCEVVRRCARTICPIDPPQQKPPHRLRKYALSDIVGPVTKKDSWVQTDPLPPPRRRKKKKERRRSRSVEFLPYLIQNESPKISGSLDDLSGNEDALDFQMYFMGRLPQSNLDDDKVSLPEKKKEFLTGLIGEENNNMVLGPETVKTQTEINVDSDARPVENELSTEKKEQLASPDIESLGGTNSRRSSITESLKEFESSLMDMLEEDDSSLPQNVNSVSEENDRIVELVRKGPLAILKEEHENEYIITPIEEEPEDYVDDEEEGKVNQVNEKYKSYKMAANIHFSNNNCLVEGMESANVKDVPTVNKESVVGKCSTNQTPTITVEIVS